MNQTLEISMSFNEAEALGLLDLVLLCPGELSVDQHRAALKLSDVCRQLLRSSSKYHITPDGMNPHTNDGADINALAA